MTRLVIIRSFIVVAMGFLLVSCEEDGKGGFAQGEPDATLSISLSAPAVTAEVKGVSSDPDSPRNWTQWERVTDGRYLYRVTAFLLQGNRLLAIKDLDLSGEVEPSEAHLSFDGNFVHGTYRLMVLANYSAHTADDGSNGQKTYAGLTDLVNTVQEILNTSGVLENFTNSHAASFINYMISSDEGICPKLPQPLSLLKDVELHPGENVIEGELQRTYSRIRIELENQSDESLNISSLEFCDIFTQTKSYLFPNIGYASEKTALNVAHSDAIIPFTATETSPMAIPGKSSAVVFDAYILESKRGASESGYKYALGLGYGDSETYKVKNKTAIFSPDGLSKGYYLIYNARRNRYLKTGSDKVESGSANLNADDVVGKEYVWALDNTGLSGGQYYIGTPEILQTGDQTSYYMEYTGTSSVSLSSKRNPDYYFSFASYTYDRSDYMSIQASSSSRNRYLQVSNNGDVSGTSSIGNSNRFYLYPVQFSGSSIHEIDLRTIDNQTGQSYDVEEIKRNDFINVLVAVSYNKNTGHFTFEVKNWDAAGGDVSFN